MHYSLELGFYYALVIVHVFCQVTRQIKLFFNRKKLVFSAHFFIEVRCRHHVHLVHDQLYYVPTYIPIIVFYYNYKICYFLVENKNTVIWFMLCRKKSLYMHVVVSPSMPAWMHAWLVSAAKPCRGPVTRLCLSGIMWGFQSAPGVAFPQQQQQQQKKLQELQVEPWYLRMCSTRSHFN